MTITIATSTIKVAMVIPMIIHTVRSALLSGRYSVTVTAIEEVSSSL